MRVDRSHNNACTVTNAITPTTIPTTNRNRNQPQPQSRSQEITTRAQPQPSSNHDHNRNRNRNHHHTHNLPPQSTCFAIGLRDATMTTIQKPGNPDHTHHHTMTTNTANIQSQSQRHHNYTDKPLTTTMTTSKPRTVAHVIYL